MKPCEICKLSIETNKERYLVLQEYVGKKRACKFYYHAECFKEKMLAQNQIKNALGVLGQLTNKAQEMSR